MSAYRVHRHLRTSHKRGRDRFTGIPSDTVTHESFSAVAGHRGIVCLCETNNGGIANAHRIAKALELLDQVNSGKYEIVEKTLSTPKRENPHPE